MNDYFYGWYFRCQGKDGSIAVIPAVHLSEKKSSCSIQIITQSKSLYREFPVDQFRISRKKGVMRIGENLFSRKGICLKLDTVRGILRFGRFQKPKYDIMGPFSCIPGMECRHMVYSLRHTVNGRIALDGQRIRFEDGMGYMEGDCGTSFPERYIWTQHFLPEGSVMLAAASVPLAGIHFTGVIGFYLRNGKEYRFATYLGASVRKMNSQEISIRQGRCRLRVRFEDPAAGHMLQAPENGQMTRQVRESAACRAEYTLTRGKRILLHAVTDVAAAEYDEKKSSTENHKFIKRYQSIQAR